MKFEKLVMLLLLVIMYLIITKCKCKSKEEFSQINNKQEFLKQAMPWWVYLIIVLIYIVVSFAVKGDPFLLFYMIGSIISAFN